METLPILQQINKATGYTPDMGKSGGAVYAPTPSSAGAFPQGGAYQAPATTYQAPDPYAQYGGQAVYNTMVPGFNAQKNNIYGT